MNNGSLSKPPSKQRGQTPSLTCSHRHTSEPPQLSYAVSGKTVTSKEHEFEENLNLKRASDKHTLTVTF